jgi:hypothetical protein
MRSTTVTCDRCSCVIDERVVVLDLLNGVLPRLRGRVDLCSNCADHFADWLAEGKTATDEPSLKLPRVRTQP